MANQPEPSANPTIDLTEDVPTDGSPVAEQVGTSDPNALQAIAVQASAGAKRITLSSSDMGIENIFNVIREQDNIIRWQRNPVNHLEAFPGREALVDTIVEKDERIQSTAYRIDVATKFLGRDALLKEIDRLQKANEGLAIDRDRWMGVAKGTKWWLPTMANDQNILGENLQESPEEVLFPPEVFGDANLRCKPPEQSKKKDASVLGREIRVPDKMEVLVDNADAGSPSVSESATSSREDDRLTKTIKLSLKTARERDALLAVQADVPSRPNVDSHQLLSAVGSPEALREDVTRSLDETAVAEATNSGHDVGVGEKASPPPTAKGKGVLRIVTSRSPPRDVQATAPSAPNTQKRKHVPEDTAAALAANKAPTMPELEQTEHSGIRAKKRRRLIPQAPAATRQKLPRACKKDRKY